MSTTRPEPITPAKGRKGATSRSRAALPGFLVMALAVLAFLALGLAQPAMAQTAAGVDMSAITNGPAAADWGTDWSLKMWASLFGDFARNPFSTLGGPTTLLGSIFLIFNTCVFVFGFSWALWGIVGAVVHTAHEGEVLGKRMSTVWFPIRMIMGISGMVPIFGGFTLMQAVMMSFTTVGIGIGNAMWSGAVNNTSQMQALMTTQPFLPTSTTAIRGAAKSMFMSSVCVQAQAEDEAARLTPEGGRTRLNVINVPENYEIDYGTPSLPMLCGSVSLKTSVRQGSSATGFRVASVSYDQVASTIGAAVTAAHRSGAAAMQDGAYKLATTWYQAYKTAKEQDASSTTLAIPLDELNALADAYIKTVNSATQNATGQDAITQGAKANMLAVGWFGAGAWYSTFAEVNAAIADAAKGPNISYSYPGMAGWPIDYTNTAKEVMMAAGQRLAEAAATKTGNTDTGYQTLLDSALRDSCNIAGLSSFIGTPTGNCSLGQGIVSAAIRGTAIGSGGGGNAAGNNTAIDSSGMVNPIIMMKNVGDYIMSACMLILAAGPAAELASGALKVLGSIGNIGGIVSGNAAVTQAATAVGVTGQLFAIATTLAMIMMAVGAAMSIYIPMIPFIHWMGAIMAYAASMIEGLAGASLHAMAHLDADGEGLGHRTQHGYIFMLNAVLRPGLMIIGFFTASALLIAIGTLQAQMFLPAMAGVQGNSITGLFSILMFIIVFFVMNMTLISAAFNLIYVVTDQVLGFLGGQINSHLGRETEGNVKALVVAGAQAGPRAISAGQHAIGAAKDAAGKKKLV